jgi:hypothetical protein
LAPDQKAVGDCRILDPSTRVHFKILRERLFEEGDLAVEAGDELDR